MAEFWKRVKFEPNNAFWKRAQFQSFWKRLRNADALDDSSLQDTDHDTESNEETSKRNYGGSTDVTFGKQQRRGHESSQRRPEFNPTGW
jgi:hypothetical protein